MDATIEGIQIISPSSGQSLTLEDDQDGDPTNGLQIEVLVGGSSQIASEISLQLEERPAQLQNLSEEDQTATFVVTLPAATNATYTLLASADLEDGSTVTDQVDVTVFVSNCELTIANRPSATSCEIGPGDDVDDATAGVQLTSKSAPIVPTSRSEQTVHLRRVSPCSPAAEYTTTIISGRNELEFSVSNGSGEPIIETVAFDARTETPNLEFANLSPNIPHVFRLAEGAQANSNTYWNVTVQTAQIGAASDVLVEFTPDFPGTASLGTIRADGTANLEIALPDNAYYEGSLQLTATSTCGDPIESPELSVTVRYHDRCSFLSCTGRGYPLDRPR